MAQIQSPETFVNGQQVTDTRLNNHVNGALLLPGAITDQTLLASNTLATGDQFIVNDVSASALRKVDAESVLNSGLPITTSAVTGSAGADISITPAATYKLNVAGNLAATGNLAITGTTTITGALTASSDATVSGKLTLSSTGAVKIPTGTTAERPATPATGDIRYNTTTSNAEIYNGTAWEEVGGGPFDATGGNIVIAPDTTVVSGVSFTSANGYQVTVNSIGHTVHPGQTIRFTTAIAGYSGEFTVYEKDANSFKFFMTTIATPNSGTGDYQKAGNFKCHIFTSTGTFKAGPKDGYVEVLCIGGGGGGVYGSFDLGGSCGGVAYVSRYKVEQNEEITVSVGAGGLGDSGSGAVGGNGGSSTFDTIIAYGGNGSNLNGADFVGSSGGNNIGDSGSGQGDIDVIGRNGAGYGSKNTNYYEWSEDSVFYTHITGVLTRYCAGGIGKNFETWDESGDGTQVSVAPTSGIRFEMGGWKLPSAKGTDAKPNTGSGGGAGGNGGSGIVIVRYPYWI